MDRRHALRNGQNGDQHRLGILKMPRIAVIIVNFHTASLASEAVESLRQLPGGKALTIHLVDNASPEADRTSLRDAADRFNWGSRVRLHWNEVNLGFGQANNQILAELSASDKKPDYVLFLNPDAQANNDVVTILAEFLEQHEHAAFAGPAIRLRETGELRHAGFRFPGLLSTFLRAVGHPMLYRRFPNSQIGIDSASVPTLVDWVSGACCMARFEALEGIGFFDPDFFLYWEEVELMHRAVQREWQCWHVPRAEVLHQEGASTGVSSREDPPQRRPGYWYKSWAMYFRKTHGRSYALLAASLWMFGAAINRMFESAGRARRSVPHKFYSDFWTHGVCPLLGFASRSPNQDQLLPISRADGNGKSR